MQNLELFVAVSVIITIAYMTAAAMMGIYNNPNIYQSLIFLWSPLIGLLTMAYLCLIRGNILGAAIVGTIVLMIPIVLYILIAMDD